MHKDISSGNILVADDAPRERHENMVAPEREQDDERERREENEPFR